MAETTTNNSGGRNQLSMLSASRLLAKHNAAVNPLGRSGATSSGKTIGDNNQFGYHQLLRDYLVSTIGKPAIFDNRLAITTDKHTGQLFKNPTSSFYLLACLFLYLSDTQFLGLGDCLQQKKYWRLLLSTNLSLCVIGISVYNIYTAPWLLVILLASILLPVLWLFECATVSSVKKAGINDKSPLAYKTGLQYALVLGVGLNMLLSNVFVVLWIMAFCFTLLPTVASLVLFVIVLGALLGAEQYYVKHLCQPITITQRVTRIPLPKLPIWFTGHAVLAITCVLSYISAYSWQTTLMPNPMLYSVTYGLFCTISVIFLYIGVYTHAMSLVRMFVLNIPKHELAIDTIASVTDYKLLTCLAGYPRLIAAELQNEILSYRESGVPEEHFKQLADHTNGLTRSNNKDTAVTDNNDDDKQLAGMLRAVSAYIHLVIGEKIGTKPISAVLKLTGILTMVQVSNLVALWYPFRFANPCAFLALPLYNIKEHENSIALGVGQSTFEKIITTRHAVKEYWNNETKNRLKNQLKKQK